MLILKHYRKVSVMSYFADEGKPKSGDMIKFIIVGVITIVFLLLCVEEGLRRQDERLSTTIIDGAQL